MISREPHDAIGILLGKEKQIPQAFHGMWPPIHQIAKKNQAEIGILFLNIVNRIAQSIVIAVDVAK